ncbi:MAG: GAF domain-containing protein [Chloroflexota bacterium]|nr:MAG: GAF domain-containing protein [Chloroflexota bacterium]
MRLLPKSLLTRLAIAITVLFFATVAVVTYLTYTRAQEALSALNASQVDVVEQARQIALTAGLAGLASALVLLVIILGLTRMALSPVSELIEGSKRVAEGNYDQDIPAHSSSELGTLVETFNTMQAGLRQSRLAQENYVRTLELRVTERTSALENRVAQLKAASEVSKAAANLRDLDSLLFQVTRLISKHFGFYHIGVFMLDQTGEYAVLRAANSDGGQRMLARNHRLKVGEVGIVGFVAGHKEPRIALDVGQDATYFDNPDLPNTCSEVALPLLVGGQLLGVLDVQSTERGAFKDEDIEVLQVLADQVAIAIESARLYAENQNVLEGIRRAYGELSRQDWEQRLQAKPNLGYQCNIRDVVVPAPESWPVEMVQAVNSGQIVHMDNRVLAVPIKIRDHVAGVIKLQKPENAGNWLDEEMNMVRTITDQLSVALESARLYSETQERAEREHLQSEIVAKIRQSTSIDVILQTAIEELAQALHISQGMIQLRGINGGHSNEGL